MKKHILILFIMTLGIFVMPANIVMAAGVDGGDSSNTQPNNEFNVVDLETGEEFHCLITSFLNNIWVIKCTSLRDGDVFTMRAYPSATGLVHEVSVTTVNSASSVQSLRQRAGGLGWSTRNLSPFGQSNPNIVVPVSSASYQRAITITSPAAKSQTTTAYNNCLVYSSSSVCSINYDQYYQAYNQYLARQSLFQAGFANSNPTYEPAIYDYFTAPGDSDYNPPQSYC